MAKKPTGSETPARDEGRAELSSLLDTIENMTASGGKVFVVHGPEGKGKTNAEVLARELRIALEPTTGMEQEIDHTLARLGVGIDREIEKMDELLSRLRRTRIIA